MTKALRPFATLFALILLAVLFSACVELRPRQGVPSSYNVEITSGSDACSGYNESTCGAFVKNKRETLKNYICKGYDGPAEARIGYCVVCPGGTCTGSTCASDGECGTNARCSAEGKCIPITTCKANSDCGGSGFYCINRACVTNVTCTATSTCGAGKACLDERNPAGGFVYNLPTSDWVCQNIGNAEMRRPSFPAQAGAGTEGGVGCYHGNGAGGETHSAPLPMLSQTIEIPESYTYGLKRVIADCNIGVGCRCVDDSVYFTSVGVDCISGSNYGGSGSLPDAKNTCEWETLGFGGKFSGTMLTSATANFIDTSKKDEGEWGGQCTLSQSCVPTGVYSTAYKCTNQYRSGDSNQPYGPNEFRFVNCTDGTPFLSFQGGNTSLLTDIPFSNLGSMINDYYSQIGLDSISDYIGANLTAAPYQVPFFMIGQGASFNDYDTAKEMCNPFKEKIINISLGNTTFDPPIVSIPYKSALCFKNVDSTEHIFSITDQSTQEVRQTRNVKPNQEICMQMVAGDYKMNDSNLDYGYLTVTNDAKSAQYYVVNRIFPDYGVVDRGGVVNLTSGDSINHTMNATFLDPLNQMFNLTPSNRSRNFIAVDTGEFLIKDTSRNNTAGLFVQTTTNLFTFRQGSVDPPSNYIARPLGDAICFTSEYAGVKIDIYRESEGEYLLTEQGKDVPLSPGRCCLLGLFSGTYKAITNNNTQVEWLIGSRKPTGTVEIRPIGFEPGTLDDQPGVKVCWQNPSLMTRAVGTNSTKPGRPLFATATVGSFGQACIARMDKSGSFISYFVSPPVTPKQVLNLEQFGSYDIKILDYGFDPQTVVAQPGDAVCWINTGKAKRTLKSETGTFYELEPTASQCFKPNVEGYLSMTLVDINTTCIVGVVQGEGIVVTPYGVTPTSLSATMSNETNSRYVTILNEMNDKPARFDVDGSLETITLPPVSLWPGTPIQVSPLNITAISNITLSVLNTDADNAHVVDVCGTSVTISPMTSKTFDIQSSCKVTDNTLFQLTGSTLNSSCSIVISSQPIPTIPAKGRFKLLAPNVNSVFQLTEKTTGAKFAISFMSPNVGMPTTSIADQTMDLAIQRISGYPDSDMLMKMRQYAAEGTMSVLVPSFKNATVIISSSVFSPSYLNVSAGSTIVWTNEDNIPHTVTIRKTTIEHRCDPKTTPINYVNIIGCNLNQQTQSCEAKLISAQAACAPLYANPNSPGTVTSCVLDARYSRFTSYASCAVSANTCILSTSNYAEDGGENYCSKVAYAGASSTETKILDLGDNYTASNIPANTQFVLTDTKTGYTGTYESIPYDALVSVWTSDLDPYFAEVGVATPIFIKNYDTSVDYTAQMQVNDQAASSFIVPRTDIWGQIGTVMKQFSSEGTANISFSPALQPSSTVKLKISNAKEQFNVTVGPSGFSLPSASLSPVNSMAIDAYSKVCFDSEKVRNLRISRINDSKTVNSSTVIPSNNNIDGSSACAPTFGCSTADSSLSACRGTVDPMDPNSYCQYKIISPTDACDVSVTTTCTANTPYASDITCSEYYGTAGNPVYAVDSSGKLSLGVCRFVGNSPICQGGCIAKTNNMGNLVCQKSSGPASCNFSYSNNPGTPTSTAANSICSAYPSCTPTNSFSDIGCVSGASGAGTCYYTPSPIATSELTTIKYTNRFCEVFSTLREYTQPGTTSTKITVIDVSSCNSKWDKLGIRPVCTITNKTKVNSLLEGCALYTGERSCQVQMYGQTTPPYQCTSVTACPCLLCQLKGTYSSYASSIICNNQVTSCQVTNPYGAIDDTSGFCGKTFGYNCEIKDGNTYGGSVLGCDGSWVLQSIPKTGSDCTLRSQYVNDVFRNKCTTSATSNCEKRIDNVLCAPSGGTCVATRDPAANFCFGNGDYEYGDYLVEDLESGNTMKVTLYDKTGSGDTDPLSIGIKGIFITPFILKTSPASHVCFKSLDGNNHTFTVPASVVSSGTIQVPALAQTCVQVPYSTEPFIFMSEKPPAGLEVRSILQNSAIKIRNRIFDPESIILRPGSQVTFINKDNVDRRLYRGVAVPYMIGHNLIGPAPGVITVDLSGDPAGVMSIGSVTASVNNETCGGDKYGKYTRNISTTFTIPTLTQKATLSSGAKTNAIISINGYTLLSTHNRCDGTGGSMTYYNEVQIPLELLKLGSTNALNITLCSCTDSASDNPSSDVSIAYLALPSAQPPLNVPVAIIVPALSSAPLFLNTIGSYSYFEPTLQRSLAVSVKECGGGDLASIATKIGSYERLGYNNLKCDLGSVSECKSYNPYGPATIAILASEEGLDLTNGTELQCAMDQISYVKAQSVCPQCTSALYVGDMGAEEINTTLKRINTSSTYAFDSIDVIARSMLLNTYPGCEIGPIMKEVINASKLALYDFKKPTLLLDFGLKPGFDSTGTCVWTDESIKTAYSDFYGLWIPILAGSGTVGASQYCLNDPCPHNDNYGLLDTYGNEKPYTQSWFKEGCGRYYYYAEGLVPTTFSMYDTNYSMCDPSRMMAMLQSFQCDIGKQTLKGSG